MPSEPLPSEPLPNTPSRRIAERFEARVDPVLAAWWDDGIWQTVGGNEFCVAVDPARWLGETLDDLWPGLMPCHLMPLIGNGAGDYLCARIGDHGVFGEIVHWYHGGGDWIPWGGNLADALCVDAWAQHLPGVQRRSAVAAVGNRDVAPQKNAWYSFACEHGTCPDAADDVAGIAETMWQRKISPLALIAGQLACHHASIAAESESSGGIDPRYAEDVELAVAATHINPNLAWTWDTAGRAAEAAGDQSAAIEHYTRGARCSWLTSQSVRMGTHHDEASTPKFAIRRLQSIAPEVVRGDDYFRRLTMRTRKDRQAAVQSYWLDIAAAQDDGSGAQLFALHMSAWDIGLESLTAYADAIACIAESAELGGRIPRSRVAQLHLATMRSRLGVTQ